MDALDKPLKTKDLVMYDISLSQVSIFATKTHQASMEASLCSQGILQAIPLANVRQRV